MCGNHFKLSDERRKKWGSPPRVREPRKPDCNGHVGIRITPACAGTTWPDDRQHGKAQDHPRVCGNHRFPPARARRTRGSPPRVREPLSYLLRPYHKAGITPACAGTTSQRRYRDWGQRDHPRVCGNHSSIRPTSSTTIGSPPRVREPLSIIRLTLPQQRITPACAGTTRQGRPRQRSRGDHPRVCGNHFCATTLSDRPIGSPPRVREPPCMDHLLTGLAGITPACAGTTPPPWWPARTPRDHPRVCGNHNVLNFRDFLRIGSPPRVREPLLDIPEAPRSWRITPACAGTTFSLNSSAARLRDHPRVCGNHVYPSARLAVLMGSPPRVREPLKPLMLARSVFRITPACAGTTIQQPHKRRRARDHPRVCGNHSASLVQYVLMTGSPPRVREPPVEDHVVAELQRITPACAGTTTALVACQ